VNDAPPEFKRHRYLTAGEAERGMDPAWQGIESTSYAFRTFKRLFYLTSEHREQFLPEVNASLTAFEGSLIAAQPMVERTALKLYDAGEPDLAASYLTYYSKTEAMNGLRLAEALAASIEARTKVQFGIRDPQKLEPGKP
jgi:dipeptidase